MTAVIDASVLVAYCLCEEGLDSARVKEHLRTGVLSIDLVRVESANAIFVAKKRGIVNNEKAKAGLESMLELCNNNIELVPESDEMINDAFEISQSNNIAIYDSLYLSIARKTGSKLLSKDEIQNEVAKKLRIEVDLV